MLVAPFASRIHGESYYWEIYNGLKKYLEKSGLNLTYLPVVTNQKDIQEITEKRLDAIPLIVALTGGVSKLIQKFVISSGYNKAILLSHGEHNSLASAISARANLELENVSLGVYYCSSLNSPRCTPTLDRMIRVIQAVSSVLGTRVLLICSNNSKQDAVKEFERLFEATVETYTIESLINEIESESDGGSYADHFMCALNKIKCSLPKDRLIEVAKLYSVLRHVTESGNYGGIAIDCFPYLETRQITPCLSVALLNSIGIATACEGDLSSLATMMISKSLVGTTGWIANTSSLNDNKIHFAHCTVPLSLGEELTIVSHFESGCPYSLTGKLRKGPYTAISLSLKRNLMLVAKGYIMESGLMHPALCRTQSILEVDFNVEKLPNIAVTNHHVIVPMDVREELKDVANVLGLKYAEYSDFA